MLVPDPKAFFLIVYDADRHLFAIEGPMLDDAGWERALQQRRRNHEPLYCVPSSRQTRSQALREWRLYFPGWKEVEPGSLLAEEAPPDEVPARRRG